MYVHHMKDHQGSLPTLATHNNIATDGYRDGYIERHLRR